jgi:hypothetical protein
MAVLALLAALVIAAAPAKPARPLSGIASDALAAPATADAVEVAASALRSNPVYVDPSAERRLDAGEADRIRNRIQQTGAGPMYVAILPRAAAVGGDPDETLRQLVRAVGRNGTYAVVVGDSFRATSNTLPQGEAGKFATEAFAQNAEAGVTPTLLAFVERVGRARRGEAASPDEGGGGDDGTPWALLVLAGAAGGGYLLWRRRRRRRQQAELEPVRAAAREDLVALGDDIRALDLDVEMPSASAEAKAAYGRALDSYERADGRVDRARRPEDLEQVAAALEEGRFEMATAKALLEGRQPPERRPPCFFDPRHGPSDRDVEWAPPGGAPRQVPACEADAQRVERGLEPAAREVSYGGQRYPYWGAPGPFAPYAGGYFGAWGGLLPGILLGSMVGGGWGSPGGGDEGGGFEDGSDGGDFDGGDFDGGDFGGGDFGGGDFGGGDFGGGE